MSGGGGSPPSGPGASGGGAFGGGTGRTSSGHASSGGTGRTSSGRRAWVFLVPLAVTLVVYGVCSAWFSGVSHAGLISPDGNADATVVSGGLATLALRLVVLFVAVPMGVAGVVAAGIRRR